MSQYIIKNINLFELTRQIFGITANVSTDINFFQQNPVYDGAQIRIIDPAQFIGESVFGTPVFETLSIKDPDTGELIQFEDAPLMEISLPINVKKSTISQRPGTVKEYINRGDYQVIIKGLLCNHTGEDLPHDKIEALNLLMVAGVALEVESRLLNALGIYNLVVEDFKLNRNDRYCNVQPYTWRACSDDPIELNLDPLEIKDTASFQSTLPG